MEKTYFSKLLLFGEHTVNLGSQALAMPLHEFSGMWATEGNPYDLEQFCQYLDKLKQQNQAILAIDTIAFAKKIGEGLCFDSTVPRGYGVGSSGVLCAAIYDVFGINKIKPTFLNLNILKNGFAQMESYFHGKSSGVDPLVCYLDEPLLITAQGITTVNLPTYLNKGNAIFLLDTTLPRKAEPLIQWFMQASQDADFQSLIKKELVESNNKAINAFLEGHWPKLMQAAHDISQFQYQHLSQLIPDSFHTVWRLGLDSSDFKLKICGAGGGGFILGMARDFEVTQRLLQTHNLIKII